MATYTGDRGGADLTLANGDVIHGAITGVGRFSVPAGVTVTVLAYNGSSGGSVAVTAREIVLNGIIDARGAGWRGAAGGAGGDSSGATGGGNPDVTPCDAEPFGPGGAGGGGQGPRGGAAGAAGYAGINQTNGGDGGPGGKGGYAGAGVNGDVSTDEAVLMGSSGGAGGGGGGGPIGIGPLANCNFGGGGGGGGGASPHGGGAVSLTALWSLSGAGKILTSAALAAGDGQAGGNAVCRYDRGAGGDGGNPASAGSRLGGAGGLGCWQEPRPSNVEPGDPGDPNQYSGVGTRTGNRGGAGGAGGVSAGGGVLLRCLGPWPLAFGGEIDSRGSGNDVTNYGSTKIFGLPGRCAFGGTANTGHAGAGGFGAPLIQQSKHWAHPVC